MAVGFPPRFRTSFEHGLEGDEVARRIVNVVSDFGWSLTDESEASISVIIGGGLLSWGEKLVVRWDERSVFLESRCRAQLIDWGKNKANVLKFVAAFDAAVGHRASTIGGESSPAGVPAHREG